MRGLLADVNVQGHLTYLHRLLVALDFWPALAELNLRFAIFAEFDIPPDILDRDL